MTPDNIEELREKLIDSIDDRRFDDDYPKTILYKDIEYIIDKVLPVVLALITTECNRVEDETRKHMYTEIEVRLAVNKALSAKTTQEMVAAILEDVSYELAQLQHTLEKGQPQ
jgi:hypothetical protein